MTTTTNNGQNVNEEVKNGSMKVVLAETKSITTSTSSKFDAVNEAFKSLEGRMLENVDKNDRYATFDILGGANLILMRVEYVLTTEKDIAEYIEIINSSKTYDKPKAYFSIIRSRKQKELRTTCEELQYAVEEEDVELLEKIFMDKIYPDWLKVMDKSKFAERYFAAVRYDRPYVSFKDIYQAK